MGYYNKMLDLYFKEKNYTKEEIEKILDENPFDSNFSHWESNILFEGKLFSNSLKKNGIVGRNDSVQELVSFDELSVCKNVTNYVDCIKINGSNVNGTKVANKKVIYKGHYDEEYEFLKFLEFKRIPFAIGICTKDRAYYKRILEIYKFYLLKFKNSKLLDETKYNRDILIFKSR